MNLRRTACFAATFLAVAGPTQVLAQQPDLDCASYSIDDLVGSPEATNGNYPTLEAGDEFTFQMTPEGANPATTASWRIVSDGSGDPGSTLTGGGTVSGTLTYTVTIAAPGGAGVGYYVDNIDGTARITGSCNPAGGGGGVVNNGPTQPIPTLSQWGVVLLSLFVAGAALFGMRRRPTV